mmetsp:Transcript_9660/g.17945  ORF Transcript_9660/g.17945 Transcript_9660/m.17945 type:complete len:114 (-) Transcript_9660:773-1114(-)
MPPKLLCLWSPRLAATAGGKLPLLTTKAAAAAAADAVPAAKAYAGFGSCGCDRDAGSLAGGALDKGATRPEFEGRRGLSAWRCGAVPGRATFTSSSTSTNAVDTTPTEKTSKT